MLSIDEKLGGRKQKERLKGKMRRACKPFEVLKNIYWINMSNIYRKGYLKQSIMRYVDGNAIMTISYLNVPLNTHKK